MIISIHLRSLIKFHKKIRIPKESAIDVMEELGKLDDCIQFVDLNLRDFEERKNFGNLIERCDEALKNIQAFENMTQLYEQKINKYENYESFKIDLENDMRNMDKNLGSTYFDLIENETAENNRKLKELVESYNSVNEQLTNLVEKKSVYDKSSELVLSQLNNYKIPKKTNIFSGLDNPSSVEQILKMEDSKNNDSLLDDYEVSELNFISGIIKAEDDMRMKRMIFRASRGRALPTFFDLTVEDKLSKTKVEKKYLIFLFKEVPKIY